MILFSRVFFVQELVQGIRWQSDYLIRYFVFFILL